MEGNFTAEKRRGCSQRTQRDLGDLGVIPQLPLRSIHRPGKVNRKLYPNRSGLSGLPLIVLSSGLRYSIHFLPKRAWEEVMAEEKTCKNPCCSCPQPEDGKYCSASCEGTGDTIELDCDCS